MIVHSLLVATGASVQGEDIRDDIDDEAVDYDGSIYGDVRTIDGYYDENE